jgi:hypothetical protein
MMPVLHLLRRRAEGRPVPYLRPMLTVVATGLLAGILMLALR